MNSTKGSSETSSVQSSKWVKENHPPPPPSRKNKETKMQMIHIRRSYHFPPERLLFNSDKQSLLDAIGGDCEESGICPNLFETSVWNFTLSCFWGFQGVPTPSMLSCSLSLPPCKARVLYMTSIWMILKTLAEFISTVQHH